MEVNLIIENVNVYNSYFKKFIKSNVAVHEDKFIHVGLDFENRITSNNIVDGQGKYMIPGLIDIHMHIESSMTIPSEFAKSVIKHGVTTVVADPHEIANALGMDGIKAFLEKEEKVDIFYGIPSSVPSTSRNLETSEGFISDEEVSELLCYPKVLCLGEVMNFKDLIEDDNSNINKIIRTVREKDSKYPLEGHCPKIKGVDLSLYIYRGVDGDHTQQTVESIAEKAAKGMFLEIQRKSMTKENMDYLMENNLYEHFSLVTDDVMADKLTEGHLNELLKKAVEMGMSIENAIYVTTYTPARRMGLIDRGAIAPGKIADFILVDNLDGFNIDSVYKDGDLVYKSNLGIETQYFNEKNKFPNKFYNTIKLHPLCKEDFVIEVPQEKVSNFKVKCRTINVQKNSNFTEQGYVDLEVKDGKLMWENEECALVAVFERYGKNKGKAFGIVKGEIIKEGAVATTWAHDHHNLMVMGTNLEDMIHVANEVITMGGGYAVANNKEILGALPLPIGGIISDEPIESVGSKLSEIRNALKKLGYTHMNEIMSFSTLSLPVSPALKISDKGLIDVKKQQILSLFV